MADYYVKLPPTSGGGSGVTSVNSANGALTLTGGANVTVSTVGTTITVADTIPPSITPFAANTSAQRDSVGDIRDFETSYVRRWWDDFDAANVDGISNWGNNSTNGGGVQIDGAGSSASLGHPGVIGLHTGGADNGVGNLYKDVSSYFGYSFFDYEMMVLIPTLSNGTDTFIVESGSGNIFNSLPFTGVWFSYTDTVNGGNWSLNIGNGSTNTYDTGVPVVAGTWYKLRFSVNTSGTTVTAMVNGTVTNTIAVNTIPITYAARFGFGFQIRKSVGTAESYVFVDYARLIEVFNTPR